MALNSGPRPRARRWSAAIYDTYPHIGGLWYPSSMYGGTPAVALYERIEDALTADTSRQTTKHERPRGVYLADCHGVEHSL